MTYNLVFPMSCTHNGAIHFLKTENYNRFLFYEAVLANISGNKGFELVVWAIEEAATRRNRQGDARRRRIQREGGTVAHLVQRRDHIEESHNELSALLNPVELKDERAVGARIIGLEPLGLPGYSA